MAVGPALVSLDKYEVEKPSSVGSKRVEMSFTCLSCSPKPENASSEAASDNSLQPTPLWSFMGKAETPVCILIPLCLMKKLAPGA